MTERTYDLSSPHKTYEAWKDAILREDLEGFLQVWSASSRENFVALADKHEIAINDVLEGMCSQLNEMFSHGIAMHLDECVDDGESVKNYSVAITVNGEPQAVESDEVQSFCLEAGHWLMVSKS